MDILRTPDECFAHLPSFPFAPHYVEVDGLRIHYLDEGPRDASPVLLLHGEPSWSFLYRKMVPPLVLAGHRVIAPDLVGFGRSDKPANRADYTYARHVHWMAEVLKALDLRDVTLFCQDWGGLIGLRLVAEHDERFARVVASNTFLPTGRGKVPMAFRAWRLFSQTVPSLPVGRIVRQGCVTALSADERAAYDAPFPEERFKAGARQFPLLVPTRPNDPATADNLRAWEVLGRWSKPFLTAFSTGDPITRGLEKRLQARIPGAAGRNHPMMPGGHFLQEDCGPSLAALIDAFISETRSTRLPDGPHLGTGASHAGT